MFVFFFQQVCSHSFKNAQVSFVLSYAVLNSHTTIFRGLSGFSVFT